MPSPVLRAGDVLAAVLWCTTYLLVLRRSALDQVSGMPLPALATAFAWETIYGVVRPTLGLPPLVVPAWLAIDVLLLVQYLRCGAAACRRSARAHAHADTWFVACTGAALLAALALEYACIVDTNDRDGVVSGFAVNVVMSLAFLAMLTRPDLRGQSVPIALAKLVGTAATIPHALALHGALLSLRAFVVVTVGADVAYLVLLDRACRSRGIRPWTRW
jgi:hypothetical protein